MWIKWKYNDHGWPDFKELEIPDEEIDNVVDYLGDINLIPTWSERYLGSRVQWERIDIPSEAYLDSLIKSTTNEIKMRRSKLKDLKELKKKHY